MFQLPKTEIRPLTTAHLAQTMALLGMTADELAEKVQSELADNPALEIVEERRCPSCNSLLRDASRCSVCMNKNTQDNLEPIVFVTTTSPSYSGDRPMELKDEDYPDQDYAPQQDNLQTYILKQVITELNKQEQLIAVYILGNLDDNGLLDTTILEIARYFHTSFESIEKVLSIIQRSDPLGVGSRSVQEAMLIQLEYLSGMVKIPEYSLEIINNHFVELSKHHHSDIAKSINTSTKTVEAVAEFIGKNLNPYPARSYWGDIRSGTEADHAMYRKPDIIISFLENNKDNPLVVEILQPYYGTLRVNPLFKKNIQKSPETSREHWKKDIERANLLVKCIQQRNNTMQRMLSVLTTEQRQFIINGDQHLIPKTRASLATQLGVHESTISRAVSNKNVRLPSGKIIPLKTFFDRSLATRTIIKDIIASESSPYTDTELTNTLSELGIKVARRTVAKYRSMEGILPAHLRKKVMKSN